MPYVALHNLFPEVAQRETRVLTVLPGSNFPLPPGEYSFVEMFCDESNCDCRRVFLMVVSLPAEKTEALISWGWENAAFYRRWFGFDDPEVIEQMQGPVLDIGSPISSNADVLLKFVAEVLLADAVYVERIKKHYALFRAAIDSGAKPRPLEVAPTRQPSATQQKVGRNDRCPCGSGKKFKNCCLKLRT